MEAYTKSRFVVRRRGEEIHDDRVTFDINLEAEPQVVSVHISSVAVSAFEELLRQSRVVIGAESRCARRATSGPYVDRVFTALRV